MTTATQPANEDIRNAANILVCAAVREGSSWRYDEADVTAMLRLLRAAVTKIEQHKCGLPASIVEALNSGDGVYRP